MNLYLILIIVICLIGIKFQFKDFNKEYLSKDTTSCIKGIFILIVFYSHLCAYIPIQLEKDGIMLFVRNFLGQLMVTMFLFYSGYGVYESIKKKKEKYINSIPKKRILKTLLHFDVAVLTFAIVNAITGYPKSISNILWALTGWGGLGNSNWYIFAILFLYFGTYLSFNLLGKEPKKAVAFNWIYTIALMIVISVFKGEGYNYCYNTLLCYPLGMTYSLYKTKIESIIFNNKNYLLTLPTIIVLFIAVKQNESINDLWYSITSICFVLTVLLITMKVNIKNPILKWFGDNLFWIYILQRLPMLVLSRMGYAVTHAYRFAIICFVVTIVLTIIYKKIFEVIDKKIFEKQ